MLKFRDKQAFPNAPEWAKRMKIKKRPMTGRSRGSPSRASLCEAGGWMGQEEDSE